MKRFFCLLGLASCLVVPSAHAITITDTFIYNGGFSNGNVVPDGDPTGLADLRIIASTITSIDDITVGLDISGTWNGDLYATLQHDSGFAVLLNRVGRTSQTGLGAYGFDDDGFNVIFDDSPAGTDIHGFTAGGGQVTGLFGSDGRTADPDLVLAGDPRSAFLTSFNGLDPNGNWTLFLADMVNGDQATLNSWSLTITGDDGTGGAPVPDGGSTALMLTLALLALLGLQKARRTPRVAHGPSPMP